MFGLRIIKSGIAVIISAFISDFLNLHTPFFICMTAFITMEKTLLTSLTLGKNRTVGTAIGALIGGGLSIYFPGNALVAGIAVMLCIKICTVLKLNGAIFISGIVCIACILHVSEGVGILYAFERTTQTFLGMLVSILLNVVLLPYYNIERLAHLQQETLNAINENDIHLIHKSLQTFEENINLYKNEIIKKSKKAILETYDYNLSIIKSAVLHLEIINSINDEKIIEYHIQTKNKLLNQLR